MTQFDESKHRRDGKGQFATKGPAAEETGVQLGFAPDDADPAEFGLASDSDHTSRVSACPGCGEPGSGHIGGGTKMPGEVCPRCDRLAPDVSHDDGEVTTVLASDGSVSRYENSSDKVLSVSGPDDPGWDEDVDRLGADPGAVRDALRDRDPDYQAAMDELAEAQREQMIADLEADEPVNVERNDHLRTTTYTDAEGNLHRNDGPAYAHDWGAYTYAQHGVMTRDPDHGPAAVGLGGNGSAYEGQVRWQDRGGPYRGHNFPAIRREDGKMEFYSAPGERDEQPVPPLFQRRREGEKTVLTYDSTPIPGRILERVARQHEVEEDLDEGQVARSVAVDEVLRSPNVQYGLRNGFTRREMNQVEKDALARAIDAHEHGYADTKDDRIRGYAHAAGVLSGGEFGDGADYANNVSAALKLGRAKTPTQLAKIAKDRGWGNSFEVRRDLADLERRQQW